VDLRGNENKKKFGQNYIVSKSYKNALKSSFSSFSFFIIIPLKEIDR
jgi:hypothetical protein